MGVAEAIESLKFGQPCVGLAHQKFVAYFRGKLGGLLGHFQQGGVGHQGRRPSVVQDVGRLVPLVGGVDGHADGTDEGQAEPAVHELSAVGQEQADAVAMADAGGAEHAGSALDGVVEVSVGDLLAGDLEEDLVWVALNHFGEELAEGLLPREMSGGVEGSGHVAFAPLPS